jgi:GMP synthase (glutamine-hydrolysing)
MLLQLGEAPEQFPTELGGYLRWFESAWDGPLDLVDGRPEAGTRLPDPRDYAGVIVTGSPASLATDVPPAWMDDAAQLVRRAHEIGTPLLGVCFGHQLIGHKADPLFAGLPGRVRVNLTHRDIICPATCPPELRVLARNEAAEIQAVAVGDSTWGVQFHPEICGTIMRGYIHARRPLLDQHHDCDELHASSEDCPDAARLMHNFRATVLTS